MTPTLRSMDWWPRLILAAVVVVGVVVAYGTSTEAQQVPALRSISLPATSNGRVVCGPANLPAASISCRGTASWHTSLLVSAIDGNTTKVSIGPGNDGGQSNANGAVICDGCLLTSVAVESTAGIAFCRSQGTNDAGVEVNVLCGGGR